MPAPTAAANLSLQEAADRLNAYSVRLGRMINGMVAADATIAGLNRQVAGLQSQLDAANARIAELTPPAPAPEPAPEAASAA